MPPLDPPGPPGIGALDDGHVVTARPDGSVAVPQAGDHFLERVKGRLVRTAGGRGMGHQPGERRGGQVGQAGTAVNQERLGQHTGQLMPAIADLAAVTPPVAAGYSSQESLAAELGFDRSV